MRVSRICPLLGAEGVPLRSAAERLRALIASLNDLIALSRGFVEQSVLGVRSDRVIERFLTQMPARFDVAAGPVIVQGAFVEVDETSGRAAAIRRVRERMPS